MAKICRRCKIEKEIEAFGKSKVANKTYIRHICKKCHNSQLAKIKNSKPLYNIWCKMRSRCFSLNSVCYKNYGMRGIGICKSWDVYNNFKNDMLATYKSGLTLERKDNDGDYSPENCKWATKKEQARNRRSNHPLTLRGKTMLITDWAKKLGIKRTTLSERVNTYKWSIEKALSFNIK